jgi:hypothetical protein
MSERRRLARIAAVLAVFGLASLFRMLGKPSFETVRLVDAVQLIGTGMCFGAAIVALVLLLRGPRYSS